MINQNTLQAYLTLRDKLVAERARQFPTGSVVEVKACGPRGVAWRGVVGSHDKVPPDQLRVARSVGRKNDRRYFLCSVEDVSLVTNPPER
jgi:hypothetical protein